MAYTKKQVVNIFNHCTKEKMLKDYGLEGLKEMRSIFTDKPLRDHENLNKIYASIKFYCEAELLGYTPGEYYSLCELLPDNKNKIIEERLSKIIEETERNMIIPRFPVKGEDSAIIHCLYRENKSNENLKKQVKELSSENEKLKNRIFTLEEYCKIDKIKEMHEVQIEMNSTISRQKDNIEYLEKQQETHKNSIKYLEELNEKLWQIIPNSSDVKKIVDDYKKEMRYAESWKTSTDGSYECTLAGVERGLQQELDKHPELRKAVEIILGRYKEEDNLGGTNELNKLIKQ